MKGLHNWWFRLDGATRRTWTAVGVILICGVLANVILAWFFAWKIEQSVPKPAPEVKRRAILAEKDGTSAWRVTETGSW